MIKVYPIHMPHKEQVPAFIRSSFRSVWSLEVLLLLKRDRRAWTRAEILTSLRASDLIVSQSLDALSAAGLIAVDEDDVATYQPVGEQSGLLVEEAEKLYAQSPDFVRRLIVGSPANGLTAFADAFRLRKD